ncbi:MAG: hypothetical protein GEV06_26685 [Luteitalea sp.]|nr:hypothetical protein [Luteitalea sp.]
MQVWDILRAIEWALADRELPAHGLSLYGKSEMGVIALYAALLDERVRQVIVHEPPGSHRQGPALLNILRITDIAEAAGAFAPRRLVALTELPESFDYTRQVYERLGVSEQLAHAASLAEALHIWKYPRR